MTHMEQMKSLADQIEQRWGIKTKAIYRSGDGSLIYCYSLNNPVTDARYSGQLPESSSLIA